DAAGIAWHDKAKLTAGVRNAPGDVPGRSLVERMAEDDVAALFAEAVARALRTGAPVDLERPAQLLGHQAGDGHVEALRRTVGRLPGPRHGSRLGAEDQWLRLFLCPSSLEGKVGDEHESHKYRAKQPDFFGGQSHGT